ncbi:MAG: VOC family protein, partial [Spirochaetia bacterium]|nr:VOC family protein [Spirochaetia bacterium]
IATADLAGSIRFYRKMLGLKVEKRFRFEDETCVFLSHAGIRIELCGLNLTRTNRRRPAFSKNPTHLAMRVKNLGEWMKRLAKKNLRPDEGPFQLKNGIKTVFYRGPGGEILEFLETG